MTPPPEPLDGAWRDTSLPDGERVDHLLAAMTLEEKAAQLNGVWVSADASGAPVAPHQHDPSREPLAWEEVIENGLGQLTRPFGTAPVEPDAGRASLALSQRAVMAANRFGIPAIAHEECLTGLAAWRATIHPVPPAWGAAFDPGLVERMAANIGETMRLLGVHQGLAPVLDVARDLRWGRVEETIGEDPYLVSTIGAAYVRGLQSAGVIATLKHFAGYSASRAGRNHAPVSIGPRELADVVLPPFEAAVREGARSVMHAYNDNDGVPAAADRGLLTELLRDRWGFEGTVVSDYFGVTFLHTLQRVAADPGRAGALALEAGVDVELPDPHCYGDRLTALVRSGELDAAPLERAARRVLLHKCALGMLDPGWSPDPDGSPVDLDPAAHRALARTLAERSIVLLDNPREALPLAAPRTLALVGPLADTPDAMFGCYTFPAHVGRSHPGTALGVRVPTVYEALRDELHATRIVHEPGCTVDGAETDGFGAAVAAARGAEVCVVVLGDRSDLFGRGTSGEGCDAEDLRLPGVQQELWEALVATGTPVVAVLVTGRPYALDAVADASAAVVQAFMPGEEGASAIAGVLSGRVDPGGRLPLSVPRSPGGQPATYLGAPLARRSEVSSVDPTPRHPFGHGLSYTCFSWEDPRAGGRPADGSPVPVPTDGEVTVGCTVRNTGHLPGSEVVQVYLHDPVARVALPVRRLVGYARIDLEPGEARAVDFTVHADQSSYTGPDGVRAVDPGLLELSLAASAEDLRHTFTVDLRGPARTVDHTRRLTASVRLDPVDGQVAAHGGPGR
ncbi:beta-glucosidase [Nocardiopsis flavescens]|uniref:beta-xylosidase/alpha-l-arabinosidase n=1 Tax=Nocardiopsis flavescens TaxID=758803 RepID=UPI003652E785